jgi:hypothetical protein
MDAYKYIPQDLETEEELTEILQIRAKRRWNPPMKQAETGFLFERKLFGNKTLKRISK